MLFFGSPLFVALALFTTLLSNIGFISTTFWLSIWVTAYEKPWPVNVAFYAGLYAALTVAYSLAEASSWVVYSRGGWIAARHLHEVLIRSVLAAPLSWWKDIPVGRVVNRFSQDMKSL